MTQQRLPLSQTALRGSLSPREADEGAHYTHAGQACVTEPQSPPHTHFPARAAETALLGQAAAPQCGKSAGAALLGVKHSTPQMTPLCFEDICGVRIKHLSPPKCTEGANLCPTTTPTSAF